MARPPQPPPAVPEPVIPPALLESPDDMDASSAATALNAHRHGNGGPPSLTSAAATELARARWATESEYEDAIREHFSTVPLEEGLSLLAKMRARCELAARTIETRRTAETMNTECCVCHVKRSQLGNRNWRMVRPRRDAATGTMYTDYFCSDACVVEDNRRKLGVAAMSDRGMLPGDDSHTVKSKQQIYQEKVKAESEIALANATAIANAHATKKGK